MELPLRVLAKIGSALVHAEELLSPEGHPFDADALRNALADPEVQSFIAELRLQALVPLKR